jgi:hypothetical protein
MSFEDLRHRYRTDPDFSHLLDEKVELSTASISPEDLGGKDINLTTLMAFAHEFWLHGEVHIFEEEGTGRIHVLPPELIEVIDGRSCLRRPDVGMLFPLDEPWYTKLTRTSEEPSAFVEALRDSWGS